MRVGYAAGVRMTNCESICIDANVFSVGAPPRIVSLRTVAAPDSQSAYA